MRKLLKYQSIYFTKIIYKRFLFWISVIFLIIMLSRLQVPEGHNHLLVDFLFNGVSFENVRMGKFFLPIPWVLMLLGPNLIIFNGLDELIHDRWTHLRGLQIKKSQLTIVNLILASLFDFIYCVAIFGLVIILVGQQNVHLLSYHFSNNMWPFIGLLICFYLVVLLLTLLQISFSLANFTFSILLNIFIIFGSIFSTIRINPLNLTMTSRISSIDFNFIFALTSITLVIIVSVYFLLFKEKQL